MKILNRLKAILGSRDRAERDHGAALTDRQEEIMELLWVELIEHNKKKCNNSMLKDDEAITELSNSNYILVKGKDISLTSKGREEARNCVRRHRLAERLMVDILDIKKKLVHETGCKFEHLLHKGIDENICTLLGHPKTCPHGRLIPEGDCCRLAKKIPGRLIIPLSELKKERRVKVSYLETKDRSMLQKIIAIGALPGTEIRLIQTFPSYILQIGKSQFAIDKELASQIYVREF